MNQIYILYLNNEKTNLKIFFLYFLVTRKKVLELSSIDFIQGNELSTVTILNKLVLDLKI